jgi:plastocyanin
MRCAVFSALLVAFVAACGGGGDDGTGPSGNQTLASISVSPSPINVAAGANTSLSVSGVDTQGQPISNLTGINVTSQNPAIAEVSGVDVLGVSAGSTTISVSASSGGVSKQTTVQVNVTGTLPSNANVTAGVTNVFSPGTVVVARAGSVSWAFGAVGHNVTFAQVPGAPQSIGPPDQVNTTISRTFNTNGNFNYQCTTHAGMSGTVLVR